MESRRSGHTQQPGYRPPLAVGQQYPPLGFGPDGAARFTYAPPPDSDAQPEPDVPQYAAPPPPEPDGSRSRTLLGVAAVVVLVLGVVGVLALFRGGDDNDTAAIRDPGPVSQNTTDPYLPKSIEPTDEVPGETTRRPTPNAVEAQLSVTAAPGSAVVYIGDNGVQLVRMTSSQWRETVRSASGLLQIRVVVAPGAPASCTITVGDEVVAHEEVSADTSTVLACRVAG